MCFKKKFKEITQPPASDKQQDKIIKAWITRVNGLAQLRKNRIIEYIVAIVRGAINSQYYCQ